MYIPEKFAIDDAAWQRRLAADNAFAVLVTSDDDGLPFASHLPILWHGDSLEGHMAKANPQWRHFRPGQQVLTIFSGPHGYVSPSWYRTQPAVPTWNYATVHVYGRPRLIEDETDKKARQRRLVNAFEAGRDEPWRLDVPEKFERGMLAGIVAFEIEIDRCEGKGKLSQNRPAADRAGVIAALAAGSNDADLALATMMTQVNGDEAGG
ncbi:MAG: FMN-binding negative transcriptional regulator [Alphaproteobacteria bacterium]|jgi:transcriptional regulator|nr:FMN-binding negative transcriptional regulator [Alphaproteobacteria bacterium]MDP6565619.1 FMN-binding negative transcriptional regulator [Alphaproteobacteria bacterium]MDP6813234.1 FMN-binding negative transcriptional regulator [Alphaproteobacteria bacterium]